MLVYLGGYSAPDVAVRAAAGEEAFRQLQGSHSEEPALHWVRAGRVVGSVSVECRAPLNATSHCWQTGPDGRFHVAVRKVAPGPNPFFDIVFE